MRWVLYGALIYLAAANGLCFFLMAYDKRAARRKARRVPEKTLFLSALFFGALGGVLAMQFLRHKTQHASFRVFFPLMMAVQCVLLAGGLWLLLRGV